MKNGGLTQISKTDIISASQREMNLSDPGLHGIGPSLIPLNNHSLA
jgi:hypothetical protein